MRTSLCRVGQTKRVIALAFACAALAGVAAVTAGAQVYGVARRTTVVHGSSGTAVRSTTVVAGRPGLPSGYIAVLPGGYRAVVVRGARYYTVGGVYYRATFYQGRTVYVRTHI